MTSRPFSPRTGPAKARDLHAQASPDFAAKLAENQDLLKRAAAEVTPGTQASSLGAEDVVITHLINSLQLNIAVFVLETGALHTETLALLERTEATSHAPINVYRPDHEAGIQYVRLSLIKIGRFRRSYAMQSECAMGYTKKKKYQVTLKDLYSNEDET